MFRPLPGRQQPVRYLRWSGAHQSLLSSSTKGGTFVALSLGGAAERPSLSSRAIGGTTFGASTGSTGPTSASHSGSKGGTEGPQTGISPFRAGSGSSSRKGGGPQVPPLRGASSVLPASREVRPTEPGVIHRKRFQRFRWERLNLQSALSRGSICSASHSGISRVGSSSTIPVRKGGTSALLSGSARASGETTPCSSSHSGMSAGGAPPVPHLPTRALPQWAATGPADPPPHPQAGREGRGLSRAEAFPWFLRLQKQPVEPGERDTGHSTRSPQDSWPHRPGIGCPSQEWGSRIWRRAAFRPGSLYRISDSKSYHSFPGTRSPFAVRPIHPDQHPQADQEGSQPNPDQEPTNPRRRQNAHPPFPQGGQPGPQGGRKRDGSHQNDQREIRNINAPASHRFRIRRKAARARATATIPKTVA